MAARPRRAEPVMSGFRGDLGRLGERAGEFGEHAAEAQRIADGLRHAVESAGECWGRDEVGASFAATHRERADRAVEEAGGLAGALRDLGSEFAGVAADYRRIDRDQAEELGRITGQG
ncbi:hypothetical protein HUO13_32590 [Saccharopolyspora erythraea]|nr:hypothetical protein HUO13_32590 [Saccharopolyspora erythraea]